MLSTLGREKVGRDTSREKGGRDGEVGKKGGRKGGME